MDKAGHGFQRVLNALQESGFPAPDFPRIEGAFKAIIYAGDTSSGIKKSTKLTYAKGKGKFRILDIILKSGASGISNKQLAIKTGYTPIHISNITNNLVNEGQIIKKRRKREIFSFPKT